MAKMEYRLSCRRKPVRLGEHRRELLARIHRFLHALGIETPVHPDKLETVYFLAPYRPVRLVETPLPHLPDRGRDIYLGILLFVLPPAGHIVVAGDEKLLHFFAILPLPAGKDRVPDPGKLLKLLDFSVVGDIPQNGDGIHSL